MQVIVNVDKVSLSKDLSLLILDSEKEPNKEVLFSVHLK